MTPRRRNQWSAGPDDGMPAEEIPPGAVIDYLPGWHMVVTRTNGMNLGVFGGRRRMLHGWILTAPPAREQPKASAGPRKGTPLYRVGGAAEVVATPRRRITVHQLRPHPGGPCPCYAHSPAGDRFAPPRPWEQPPMTDRKAPPQTPVKGRHADGTDCDHDLGSPTKARASGCPGRAYYYSACKGAGRPDPGEKLGCTVESRASYQDAVKRWKPQHRAEHEAGAVPHPDHAVTVAYYYPPDLPELDANRRYVGWCSCMRWTDPGEPSDTRAGRIQAAGRAHLATITNGTVAPYQDHVVPLAENAPDFATEAAAER